MYIENRVICHGIDSIGIWNALQMTAVTEIYFDFKDVIISKPIEVELIALNWPSRMHLDNLF